MFYDTLKNDHGLRYNPFKSLAVPRPIGWISTLSKDGVVNLAPYSFFNALSHNPAYVVFSAGRRTDGSIKDSVINAEETGEFVFNMATWDLREQMNVTGWIEEPGVDEMAKAGLTPAPSRKVKPPRVAESPVHFECLYHQTVVLPGHDAAHAAQHPAQIGGGRRRNHVAGASGHGVFTGRPAHRRCAARAALTRCIPRRSAR